MEKILIVGSVNTVIQGLYELLGDLYKVQICGTDYNTIERMTKIVKPDIVLVFKNSEVSDTVLRSLNNDVNNVPVLVICRSDDECVKKYKEGNLSFIFKPVNNDKLLKMIEQLLNDEKSELKILDEVSVPEQTLLSEEDTKQGIFSKNCVTSDTIVKKKILAVDDNAMVLRGLKQILDEEYEMTLSTSVEQAVKIIEKKNFDLILLDYEMPGTDGYTAMQILKTNIKTKDWPIVFLTGVSDKKRISEVIALKPAGYLLKPVDAVVLKKTINKVLE